MLRSTRQTRPAVTACEKRGPAAASIGGVANGFLTIPAINHQTVPVYSVSRVDERKWLEVAELCAHLVGDDELDITEESTAREIVSKALAAWASKHCKDVEWLDTFELIASLEVEAYGFDCEEDPDFKPETHFWLGIQSHQMTPTINVGKCLAEFDEKHKGLARTVVLAAELAGFKTNGIMSPSFAFVQAQYMYWMGADNDADVEEEMGCCEEDGDTLMPSQFLAAFPDYCFTGDEFDDDKLNSLAASDESLKELVETIIAIRRFSHEGAYIPGMESCYGESVYSSCYMRVGGEEHSMFDRVLDDFYEQTSYGADHYTDYHGVFPVPKSKKKFLKWRDQMEKGFALYVQLDRLMNLIGEKKE